MLLVSSKPVFIEKEGTWQFVTMEKRSSAMWYICFLYRYNSVRNKILRLSVAMHKCAQDQNFRT